MNHDLALSAAEGRTTPLVVVDEAIVAANLSRMARRAELAGLRLRPHVKTHKSPALARRQVDAGAAGLTVSSLREAEVFADAGFDDLLLAHPPAGAPKLRRLAVLAERVRRLTVSLDDPALAASLPVSVDIWWEVDCGHHRVGTPAGPVSAAAVEGLLEDIDPGRFRGLLTFPGHAYAARDADGVRTAATDEWQALESTAALLDRHAVAVPGFSLGSTPTAAWFAGSRTPTEARPGAYVFNDANQVALGVCGLDDCALAVVATVVSTPSKNRAVIDAGSKALATDMIARGVIGYGTVAGHPGVTLERLSEEHGVLTSGDPTGLRVGDRLAVIPAHCCSTVNLSSALLWFDDNSTRWEPVVARGWEPS